MLYLAQVQKKGFLGKGGLRLLARQRSEHFWSLIQEEDVVVSLEVANLNEGVLVLVEMSEARQVLAVQDATDWVLEMLRSYLVTGITPEFLQQETERAEQWRQSLTLQSQELDRRALELEARREQVQALEETLKREKEKLDQEKQEIQALEEALKREKEKLDQEK
jgi:chromosome segregation ATPase